MKTIPNQLTLESYERCVQQYIDGTAPEVTGSVKKWIDDALLDLPRDSSILEIGSAYGRDAAYMESLGYAVEATDAARAFVEYLRKKGHNAKLFNLLCDTLENSYDLIFANAVLLHFTRQETGMVLKKIFAALKKGGRFAFRMKQGEGEEWSNKKLGAPRYFCYWTKSGIESVIEDTGFSRYSIVDNATWHDDTNWLHIVAFKDK